MSVEMVNTGDEINFGAQSATGKLSLMTITAWVYMDAVGAIENADWNAYMFSQYKSGAPNNDGWGFGNSDVGALGTTLALFWYRGFDVAVGAWYAQNVLVVGQWQHIAVTHDATNDANDPLLYVDGISKAVIELASPSGTVENANAEDLLIGTLIATDRQTFNGKIADIRPYDRILSSIEIKSLADSKAFLQSEYGLIFHPNLMSASGLQVFDNVNLATTNKIIDDVNGLVGTPNGLPLAHADTVLSYSG